MQTRNLATAQSRAWSTCLNLIPYDFARRITLTHELCKTVIKEVVALASGSIHKHGLGSILNLASSNHGSAKRERYLQI
jgi:hypothetical protein